MNNFDMIKESILASVPGESDRAFIEQIEISEENGTIVIGCPNAFSHKFLSRQYKDPIVKCIRKALQRAVEVDFSICAGKGRRSEMPRQELPVQMTLPTLAPSSSSSGLNSNFTFEEFVVGRSNAFAFEAAMAITEEDASRYNPLYFYSDIGLGKSHIAHAIGNRMTGQGRALKVRYTTARDFSQDYVNSIRNNGMDKFASVYSPSKLDIFFIDDVHLFKNKEKTQMELCHVMDDLISAGKQVILSGFRPPSTMTQIDKGLRSRFSSGLVIDIKSPDKTTREKIVRHKALKNGINLPEEVVEFISNSVIGSVRELESAVLTTVAMSTLMKRQVTLSLAKEILEGTLEKHQKITVDFIQDFIAKNFSISKETMISASRKKEIVYPRQVAIFLSRRYTSEPLKSIGDSFFRKHSSVIHSLEAIDNAYKQNLKVKKEIDFLIEKLETETGV